MVGSHAIWKGKIDSFSVFLVVAEKPRHTQDEVDGNIRTRGISSKIVPLRLWQHFFVIVFIHERKNWQSVFPAFPHAAFHYVEHVLLYLELDSIAELYHEQDAIKFSQGHVTKN